MKTEQTLNEAIEAGLNVTATYAPNGKRVKFIEFARTGQVEVEFQDGTLAVIDRNDLTDWSWE